jgi:large subunit ribosomal protein L4
VTTVSVVTPSGKGGADVELPGEIFGAKVNIPLIHQVVVAQEAAARQGTHATKTRGAVRGGGRKPYRQKGTGRARQGSIRAPQYAGGGIVHGPVPRSYAQRTPKRMKAAALAGALSDRTSHGRVAVVSAFVEGDEPSTAAALTVLRTAVGVTQPRLPRPVLVVVDAGDDVSRKSLRNVAGVRVLASGQLNTYDVLVSDHVVFTKDALAEFVARVSGAELVTVDKPAARPKKASAASTDEPADEPAAKPAKAAKAAKAAEEGDEPAAKPAKAAKAAEEGGEPAAKPAKAAKAAEEGGEPAAKPAKAAKAAEEGGEPAAKPARATASRAKKPAAEPAADEGGEPAAKPARATASRAKKPAAEPAGQASEEQE